MGAGRFRPALSALAALAVVLVPAVQATVHIPEASAATSGYRLTRTTLPNGKRVVVRWNPCQTITYRVNVTSVPSARRAAVTRQVRSAVDRLGDASGLRLSYRGSTKQVPQSRAPSKPAAELVIAVSRASRTDLDIGGRTVGMGGTRWMTWWRTSGSKTTYTTAVQHGFVVMDYPAWSRMRSGFGAGATQGNALLHELGHAVGLQHASSSRQIMYPMLQAGTPKGFASGDRAGLARVGRKAGCISVP